MERQIIAYNNRDICCCCVPIRYSPLLIGLSVLLEIINAIRDMVAVGTWISGLETIMKTVLSPTGKVDHKTSTSLLYWSMFLLLMLLIPLTISIVIFARF